MSILIVITGITFILTSSFNLRNSAHVPRSSAQNLFIGLTFTLVVSKIMLGSLFLLIDLSRLTTWSIDKLVNLINKESKLISLEGRRNFLIKSGLAIASIPFASFLYGITVGKYNYKVKRVNLSFSNLDPVFNGYKIIQISDIHAGSFDSKESVLAGIKLINDQEPDLVVFTGDLVNDRAEEIDHYIDVFSQIKSKDGIYSITGNHDYGDYYPWNSSEEKEANFNNLISKHEELGFELLMNESRKIQKEGKYFNLVGIENWGLPPFPQKGDLEKALKEVDSQFTLLLSHDPSHWDVQTLKHNNKVDLTLAGHTHGMQFGIEIPGIKWSPVKYRYPRWAGLYEQQGQYLYVNRGFGFLGLPGRVGIWPEITLIELNSEA
ncbi:MAG: metallophosphoesterase [Flavobacteriales bacterium]|nr:metallophosphoesterase [Flavobacteriales bacterium]